MEKEVKKTKISGKYFAGVGRRKTSIARVRIFSGSDISINDRSLEKYFPLKKLQKIVSDPFKLTGLSGKFAISALVRGGGPSSQAEAVRHGLSRALILKDPELRKSLKAAGFLKRDPRMVERKKFGLKKARRAPQWRKR
ncbi:MAG: 30S ribosomal protein S9 [Candidatus Pacebacteria bacterium]|nr:30S ribosomal protein S9 [Candidatus Paceibacterota bacterium]